MKTIPSFFHRSPTWLPLLAAFVIPHVAAPPAGAAWQWQMPPVLVNIQSTRRNHVFYKGDYVAFKLSGPGAKRYEIRDYYGNIVEQGPLTGTALTPAVRDPGWYKVLLFGGDQGMPWGTSVGSSMFVILRDDPNFPKMPVPGTYGGDGLIDEVTRGVLGHGPQRHKVDNASNPDPEIARLEVEIALDEKYYKPFDPLRKRELLIVFPNGTQDLAGVRKIVEYFKGRVRYWEPRNEPNFSMGATAFVNNELIPFYQLVKSIDPSLKVMGPGAVTVGPPMAGWNDEFFRAGGAKYIDAFSFHAYNCVNGDLGLTRMALDQVNAWLSKYNATGLEKWQTEQGYLGPVYGAYQPRLQGRWSMLQMMVYEQYGIPKERNHYWYDRNGGFWDEPRWVQNEDGSLNPVGPLLRVWSEELYGTQFSRAYNFGPVGNKLFVGSLFTGPGKQVAAFMTSGETNSVIDLTLTGATSVKVVSPFGVESTLPVVNGKLRLPISELPSYVEFTGTLDVVPLAWGANLTQQTGVSAAASGSGVHPIDGSINNTIAKVYNGQLDTWYWTQSKDSRIWESNNSSYPAWFELRLAKAQPIDRVVVYAGIPWQWDGSILDYELQVDQGGQWVTVERVKEPVNTIRAFTQTNRTTVDSFYSERCVFTHSFAPVTTQKIRLLVNDVTWGGASNKDLKDAGAQGGEHQLNLREIEVYSAGTLVAPNLPPVAADDTANCPFGGSVLIPVLANDSDPDNGPFPLKLVSVSAPQRGTAGISDGQILYTAAPGTSGPDQFTYTVTDGVSTATATVNVTVSSTPQPPGPDTHGLLGEYFNNADLTNFAFSRVDPYIDNNWGTNAPDPAVDPGTFSIRWSGKVQPKFSETYTFYTNSDDGVRLWVNGQLLIDHWSPHPAWYDQGTINLVAGQRYDIRLEYFQGGGGAQISLEWSSPSQSREVVPFGALYLGANTSVVPAANKAPVAKNDVAWTPAGAEILLNVLANDSDPDNGPLPLSISSVGTPSNGTASLLNGRIRYVPKAGFSGVDSFPYSITDGDKTVSATVSVTVGAPSASLLQGLKAEYFGKMDLTTPVLTRLDPVVNFDWGIASPDPAVPVDAFSVRWSGTVTPRYSENYTFSATSDDGVRLWVNGQLLVDNWSDHAPTEVSGTISLTAGQPVSLRMEYYENLVGAVAQLRWSSASQTKEIVPAACLNTPPFSTTVTPPAANQAPVAANDSAVTNEGTPVLIPVLANDRDPDSGPQPLAIASVGTPQRGVASVANGGIQYTPAVGFVGTDSFPYTITDGAATASATVSVSVNSTAKAADLTGGGLGASIVGTATGSSRVLADNSWELNASAVGAGGGSDSLRMEAVAVTGDFRAVVRMRSVSAVNGAARAGLMLRESAQTGARTASIALTPGNENRTGVRATAGGVFVESTPAGADALGSMPNEWVMIERSGDGVRLSVSSDGVAYRLVGSQTLTGLPATVQVGLFASSGAADSAVRAVVSDWSLSRSVVGAPAIQRGLLGVYFNGTSLTQPMAARVDDSLNFDWGLTSPHPLLANSNFSVRWTGQVIPAFSETTTFTTLSDDGVRLWVNGRLLVDNWSQHPLTENSGQIALQAGVPADVRVEYFQGTGQATLKLLWASPSMPRQLIPSSALRPGLSATALGGGLVSGSSVLPDGSRELIATGTGLRSGVSEQGGFLNQAASGDFQLAVRVFSLTGSGTPSAAVMLREALGGTDRFAAVQIGADGSLSIASRVTAGGPVSVVPVAGTVPLPNAWLMVERRADRLTLAVSADDVTYRSVGYADITGLPQLVYAGAFVGGGGAGVQARALLGDYELNPVKSAGLAAQFFTGVNVSSLRFTRTDATVNYDWGSGSPDPRLPVDGFSARWFGRVQPATTEPYTFYVQSDDGVRLWVNGQLLVDNWKDHAVTENSATISLTSGKWVDLRLEYYERAGSAVSKLLWSSPSLPKQVIPASQLSTP